MTFRAQGLLLCLQLFSMLLIPASAFGAVDEDAALAHTDFIAPITLKIDRDGFSQAQKLAAMNGVNNRQTYGAQYETRNYLPCGGLREYQGVPGLVADINGYNFNRRVIYDWLLNNRVVQVSTYNIRYPNASMAQSYGGEDAYPCSIVNDNVSKYFPSSQARNVHNGLNIPIGRRVFAKWTFRNRYDTPVPGKGNVKVFAGTFTYKIAPIVPIVSFSGEGTATVKLYLNPDNGRWTVDRWEQHDPSISLVINPLAAPAVGQGDCEVILGYPGQSIAIPYKGGCKDGLADGQGSYTYSYKLAPEMQTTVSGTFRNGKLNGHATFNQSGLISEVEEQENGIVNGIYRAVDPKGNRYAVEYRNGVLIARCSADGQREQNCIDRDKLLGTR